MKHALYSGTRNLYEDMAGAAKSLIANSDVDKVWLLTEGGYDYWLPDMCEVVDVSGQSYFPKDGPNMKSRFSYMSLMRAALALMPELAEVDRILSLDCDTVCIRDVSAVWDMPIDDCYFSASREDCSCYKGMLYCNTGVTLYNLDKLRHGKAQEVVECLNWRKYDNIEQDVFSFLCQGHIHDMPSEYNSTAFTDICTKPRIRHFAGFKAEKWRLDLHVTGYREMAWDEAMARHAAMCEGG